MISSPEKPILLPPVPSCSLSSLFPVRVAWYYLLEQDKPPPPSPSRLTIPATILLSRCPPQKRKQLKGNLLDCLCLYHLREGSQAVMIMMHCWIITQTLRFTRAYLSVCRWGLLSGGTRAATHDRAWEHEGFYSRPQLLWLLQVINLRCLFFCFSSFFSVSLYSCPPFFN